jgi:hypothetical protein
VRHATPDKVVAEIAKYGGTVLQSSLSHEDEAKLQAALKRAMAMRAEAEAAYRKGATRARRAEARELRALLAAGEFRRRNKRATPRKAT